MQTVFSIITALVSLFQSFVFSQTKRILLWSFGKILTLLSPDLWKYALELRIAKDTILYCDTCFTAQVSTQYRLYIYTENVWFN